MELGRVTGSVWGTRKADKLAGYKLLLVEPWAPTEGEDPGMVRVCADVIGAGVGEKVLVAFGSAARRAVGDDGAPVDAAVVAIVDNWELR